MNGNSKHIRRRILIAAGILLALLLAGCGATKHKLNFDGNGFVADKTEYAAGEKVTVRFDEIGTDTDYVFSIDGVEKMDQDFDGGYVFTFTMPDQDVTMHVTSSSGMMSLSPNEVWPYAELPVKLRYDRMWEYSEYAETDDAEVIAALVNAIKELFVGAPTDKGVEDYSDLLTFTFADGKKVKLNFEENIWVVTDSERYEVEGLDDVRQILDGLIESDGGEDD